MSSVHLLSNTRCFFSCSGTPHRLRLGRGKPSHRSPPMPSNIAMKDGLANALNHFPHLAGRFCSDAQLRPCIHLNGAGVPLVETRLSIRLSDWLSSFALSSLAVRSYSTFSSTDSPAVGWSSEWVDALSMSLMLLLLMIGPSLPHLGNLHCAN